MGLQNHLGIDFTSSDATNVIPWRDSAASASEWSRVCSVISAYRLRDVVAMLEGADLAEKVEQCSLEHINLNFRVREITCA